MASAKTPKSYRMGKGTLEQISWLSKRLGGLNDTEVIALAIADLYERKQEEYRTRLTSVDGRKIISVGGVPVAGVDEKSYKALPREVRANLESGSRNAIVDLVLGLHKSKVGDIFFFPEGIKQVYGFETGEVHPQGNRKSGNRLPALSRATSCCG